MKTIYVIIRLKTSDSELQSSHTEYDPDDGAIVWKWRALLDSYDPSYDVLFISICACYSTKQEGNSVVLIMYIAKIPNAQCSKSVA